MNMCSITTTFSIRICFHFWLLLLLLLEPLFCEEELLYIMLFSKVAPEAVEAELPEKVELPLEEGLELVDEPRDDDALDEEVELPLEEGLELVDEP